MAPLVTVVIPVYDGQLYLKEAIESVFAQTVSNWRLLLIDDCSNDGSRELIGQYSDPRITAVFNEANRGLYGSLAAMAGQVQTEWISILMQDDRLKPYYLAEFSQIVTRHPLVQALWATEDVIDPRGVLLVKGLDTCRLEYIEPGVLPWVSALKRGCIWTISGSLTKREFLKSVPFRTDLPHCGDYEWLLRALRLGSFLYYERSLVELRRHSGQASAGNLKHGVDVEERYVILRNEIATHADDISRCTRFVVCIQQARLVARRTLAAGVRLRGKIALTLAWHLLSFLWLALAYKAQGSTWASSSASRSSEF
jgi:glycosyltransferase involved in cell wall biosynthesis